MDTGRNKQPGSEGSTSPGRVTVDSRGRNVWQWDDKQLDSTTIMLKKLDNSALALEPTSKLRQPEARTSATPAFRGQPAAKSQAKSQAPEHDDPAALRIEQTFKIKLGGGFDPYNRS